VGQYGNVLVIGASVGHGNLLKLIMNEGVVYTGTNQNLMSKPPRYIA
jgi:hypothetical protein